MKDKAINFLHSNAFTFILALLIGLLVRYVATSDSVTSRNSNSNNTFKVYNLKL